MFNAMNPVLLWEAVYDRACTLNVLWTLVDHLTNLTRKTKQIAAKFICYIT